MHRIILSGIKYSMRDLICDVINHCASNLAMGKIKCIGYYQIAVKNPTRRRDGYHTNFYV